LVNNPFDIIVTNTSSDVDTVVNDTNKSDSSVLKNKPKLFHLKDFIINLKNNSIKQQFDRLVYSSNITAYDIAQSCSRQVLYKLLNYPVKLYESVWLPVLFRAKIGTAIHDFIQENFDFDEIEVVIKIPEFKFSGRIDAINGNDVLIEIKTVPFTEYKEIIECNFPRNKDLKQTLVYKYLLENHIEKIRPDDNSSSTEHNFPKKSNYKFNYIQFIYIAHDLISAEYNTINESIEITKIIKNKIKNDISNHPDHRFYFMYVFALDTKVE